jgi:hypothetical protein
MVTGNQGHGRTHINQLGDDLVYFLNDRDFSIEISVFSSFIGSLEVEEGKIKGFKCPPVLRYKVLHPIGDCDSIHPKQTTHPSIHGICSHSHSPHTEYVIETRPIRKSGDSPQESHVSTTLVGKSLACRLKPRVEKTGRSLGMFVPGSHDKRGNSGTPWIRVVHFSSTRHIWSKHQHKTVLFQVTNKTLRSLNADLIEHLGEGGCSFCGDATGTAVTDTPFAIKRAKIGPNGNILGLQRKLDPKRFENTSPSFVDKRIISKQCQMARTTPWRDSKGHRMMEPTSSASGELIKIRRVRRLKLRHAVRFARQAAQSVQDDQQHFGITALSQGCNLIKSHKRKRISTMGTRLAG